MSTPIFIKGNLAFKVDDTPLEFAGQSISANGVTGLQWADFKAKDHLGREVSALLTLPEGGPLRIQTKAWITREHTQASTCIGLKFQMDAETRSRFEACVKMSGFFPTEYVRKYPRIHSDSGIQTFPLRVTAMPEPRTASHLPVVFDIDNLSVNGILMHTESMVAAGFSPGAVLNLTIEPRGWFPMQISVQAVVCRVLEELNLSTGNLTRSLGVKFQRFDDTSRGAFMDMLKDILSRIKTQG